MKSSILSVTAALLCQTHAQSQYGENQRGTIKDSDVVAAAFPDVEGVELLSPAFLNPESTPPGWANGTDGPTDDAEMGERQPHLKGLSVFTSCRLLLPDTGKAKSLVDIPVCPLLVRGGTSYAISLLV
jgi:hypothetical protein